MRKEVKHTLLKVPNSFSHEKLKNWSQFKTLTKYLKQFEKISPNNSLSNADELAKTTKEFKKSLISELKNDAFKARVNVFENEVLRLKDMNSIPSITADEVNYQTNKVISLYNSMISKINTVYQTKKYNKEIDLDNFFKLI